MAEPDGARADAPTASAEDSRFYVAAGWLVVAAAVLGVANMAAWWDHSLLEDHPRRQAQTAMNVYWMLQGSPLLAYERPLTGPPFALPLEFPLYQWLVALACAFTGISLDACGRLVSFAFFVATLIPLRMIWRELGCDRRSFAILAAIFLLSPTYLHWGRAFLIESLALWLALLYLAFLMRYLRRESRVDLVAATLFGCVAVVVKVTTYVGVFAAASVFTAAFLWPRLREGGMRAVWRPILILAATHAVQLACLIAWLQYSDHVKAANPFSAGFISSGEGQLAWNFGDLRDRLSTAFLVVTPARSLRDALGWLGPVVIAAAALATAAWRDARIVAGLALFAVPALVFPRLHAVHSYYQYETAFFLLIAAALILDRLHRIRGPLLAGAALLLVCLSQAGTYVSTFLSRPHEYASRLMPVAAELRRLGAPTSHVLILGTVHQMELAYYAGKRALIAPASWPANYLQRMIEVARALDAEKKLDSVVICSDAPGPSGAMAPFVEDLIGRMEASAVEGCRVFLARRSVRPAGG